MAGVQEGVWPDLRLRGSLLGSERLVDTVSRRDSRFRAAQAAVRYDETRLFLVALTRATSHLVLVHRVDTFDKSNDVSLEQFGELARRIVEAMPDAGQRAPDSREKRESPR